MWTSKIGSCISNQQVISLYENDGLSVEEIAEALGFEISAVKMTLASGSAKYRKEVRSNDETFTETDDEAARAVMRGLLYCEDNPFVQFRAAKFMINEKRGRHNVVSKLKGAQININLIQNMKVQLQQANDAIEKAKSKIIDIPSEMAGLIRE